MSVKIVIAQLTDTHLNSAERLVCGVDTAASLERAVRAIVGAPIPIDAVIVTGDLADRGRDEEYVLFRQLVAPIRTPLFVCPGNHDEVKAMAKAFAGTIESTDAGGIAYASEAGPLRIVMLDSTVPGADHGAMTAERLRRLDDMLLARPSQPTLLGMHHPPFRIGIPHMDAVNCRDADALAALLGRHPQVLALACGHAHRSIFAQFAGRPATVAPSPAYAVRLDLHEGSTFTFDAEPPGLHLHVWSDEGGPCGQIVTHRLAIDRDA